MSLSGNDHLVAIVRVPREEGNNGTLKEPAGAKASDEPTADQESKTDSTAAPGESDTTKPEE